jgi:hypothetical protein
MKIREELIDKVGFFLYMQPLQCIPSYLLQGIALLRVVKDGRLHTPSGTHSGGLDASLCLPANALDEAGRSGGCQADAAGSGLGGRAWEREAARHRRGT